MGSWILPWCCSVEGSFVPSGLEELLFGNLPFEGSWRDSYSLNHPFLPFAPYDDLPLGVDFLPFVVADPSGYPFLAFVDFPFDGYPFPFQDVLLDVVEAFVPVVAASDSAAFDAADVAVVVLLGDPSFVPYVVAAAVGVALVGHPFAAYHCSPFHPFVPFAHILVARSYRQVVVDLDIAAVVAAAALVEAEMLA